MADITKKVHEKVTAKVEFEVEVPVLNWIDFVTKWPDPFWAGYIGGWAYGHRLMVNGEKYGWIVVEHDDDASFRNRQERGEEAERCWRDRLPLPEGCYLLDKDAAIKAYVEGVKRWGIDWFEKKGDGVTYAVALQLALLGEVRY